MDQVSQPIRIQQPFINPVFEGTTREQVMSQPLTYTQILDQQQRDQNIFNTELRKLKDENRNLENKVLSQLTLIDTLTMENNKLKTSLQLQDDDIKSYKETLKKMYLTYIQQQKIINELKNNNTDFITNMDKMNDANIDLNNDVKNVLVDRDILETRVSEGEKKYQFDIHNLTQQLSDKNVEVSDLKRKTNDLLEIKRKLEEEVAALRFALDNSRCKMEAEIKEKQIKLDQLERSFQENIFLKNQEVEGAGARIRDLELEIHRLMDQNRNYAQELTVLSKDLRFKDLESTKLREQSSGFGNTLKDTRQQQMQLQMSKQATVEGDQENNLLDQQQQMIQEQSQDLQAMKKRLKMQKALQNQDNQAIQELDEEGQQMNYEFKSPPDTFNPNSVQQKLERQKRAGQNQPQLHNVQGETSSKPRAFKTRLHDLVEPFIDINARQFNNRLKFYVLQLWKLKADLNNRVKQNRTLMNIKFDEQRPDKIIPQTTNQGKDIAWVQLLASGVIDVLSFTRTAITNVVFEVFAKSVHQANEQKLNALNVFLANMKEIKDKYWKGLLLVLETYSLTRNLLKDFVPKLTEIPMYNHLEQKINLACGKIKKEQTSTRDNLNKYIEATLAQTVQQREIDKLDKNKEFIYLFRLLTIKHRIKYPLRGKEFSADLDLAVVLEHKICQGLQKLIVVEEQ